MEVKEEGSPPPLGPPIEPGDGLQSESSKDKLCEGPVPQVKSEPEEGDVKPWVGLWTDPREAGEPSCSAWGSTPLPEVNSVACETRCPKEEPPSLTVKAEEPETSPEEKDDDLSDEEMEVDLQRHRFRNFLYKEAEGPRAAYLQLEELCYGWLQPEKRSKEEILELLILEQFLTVLPPDMESWVRARGPESCDWAVELAEDFLQWQQEADEWGKQDIGRVEEVSSTSQTSQTLLDTKKKSPGRAKKTARGSNMLGDQEMNEKMGESQGTASSEDEEDEENYGRQEGAAGHLGGGAGGMQERKVQDEIYKFTVPESVPPGSQGKPCPVCGKCFNRLSHLKRHLVIHTGEKPYKCSICGKGFTQKTNLAAHEVIHREGICSDCGKSFKLKWGVPTHHMGEMWYKCRPCKRIYEMSRPRLPVNAAGEGGMEGSSNQLVENEVEEWMCRSLKVPGGVLCKVKASAKIPGTYKGKKQSPCLVCGKVFATRSSLNRHQRIHTGEKPYICSICGKSFNQKTSLLTHSFIHSEHKPYTCSECGKSFRHSTGLLVHQRMHTGEKPYKCSICQKHFSQSSHVVKHISRKHAKEKEILSAAFATTAEVQLSVFSPTLI